MKVGEWVTSSQHGVQFTVEQQPKQERNRNVPPIDKADRRDRKRWKEREGRYLGVRYRTLRAGESLAAFETERKTTAEGKPIKAKKRKRGR